MKKFLKCLLITLTVASMSLLVVSCNDKTEPTETVTPEDTYVITFDSNGGSTVSSVQVEKSGKIPEPTEPTKEGYTFAGWYYNDKKWNFNVDIVTQKMKLTAKWTINSYEVTFILDEDGSNVKQTYDYNTLITYKPEKPCFEFSGWSYSATGTVISNFRVPARNVTVYAIWEYLGSYGLDIDGTTLLGMGICTDTVVAIPKGIVTISEHAFSGCENITEVIIPDGVKTIGKYAFSGCNRITKITLPNTVTTIEEGAFFGCSSLEEINLPAGLKTIEDGVFNTCFELKDIQIPSTVTSIGEYAFAKCVSLENLTLPTSLKTIKDGAFSSCVSLVEVKIPNTVTSVGLAAFGNCVDLESITIPFIGATSNGTTNVHFGYIFGASSYGENATYIPKGLTNLTILSGNEITTNAFYGCSMLESISLPSNTQYIREYGFSGCSGLIEITLPTNLKTIEKYAFRNCTNLEQIVIPSTVSTIGEYAFSGCSGLLSVTLPTSISTIAPYTFQNCSDLLSISIPSKVTEIGASAFYGCESLLEMTLSSNLQKIDNYAFYGCSVLTEITLPNKLKTIGSSAFEDCMCLTNVTFPSSVETIGSYAFSDCDSLSSVNIPSTVKEVGSAAFLHCSWINMAIVEGKDTVLNSSIFKDCNRMESIELPFIGKSLTDSTYTNFGYVFGGNTYVPASLTTVIINNGTKIYKNAFTDCENIKSLSIPSTITSVEEGAFTGCKNLTYNVSNGLKYLGNSSNLYHVLLGIADSITSLETINVSSGTQVIADGAFKENLKIKTVKLYSKLYYIGAYAFYGCSLLSSVTIPSGLKTIGDYAFCKCSSITSLDIPATTQVGKNALKFIDNDPFVISLTTTYDSYPWTESNGIFTSSNKGYHSTTSSMIITINTTGTLTFKYMSYGESSYDYLIIYKNGSSLKSCSSSSSYYTYSINVQEGDEIRFTYRKDGSGNSYYDYASIKDISFSE